MNKIMYLDCLSGISGDMSIGAFLDLGVEFDYLESELRKLGVNGYELKAKRTQKNGITGTKFDVLLESEKGHSHENHHSEHGHHEHNHSEAHSHKPHKHHHEVKSHHHHRGYNDIVKIIDESELSTEVKELSKKMFLFVAEAEGKIHDKSIDEVHFHEVGAVDSIVDIVGASICIDKLGIDEIIVSPLHVGTGFVKCAHGRIPVPAPATLEILKGIPLYSKGIRSELVTPTGASIVKSIGTSFGSMPEMIIENIGYGHGTKDLEITNTLRVVIGVKKKAL